MKTKRPDNLPYPNVWSKFTRMSPTGEELKLRIQDCPVEMYKDLLDFMCEYFMKDETLNNAVGIQHDNLAIEEFVAFQTISMEHKLALICVKDDDDTRNLKHKKPDILGFSLMYIHEKGADIDFTPKSDPIIKLFKVFNEMERRNKTCKSLEVDEYLGDAGMSVHPAYRKMGIGEELLKVRIPVAKTLELKVIEATFTSEPSQKVAAKIGFTVVTAVPYEEMSQICGIDFKTTSKYIKNMTLQIK